MTPGSPEWLKLITASKVAGILGVSPWESPRSIWHKMRGEVTDETNDQQRRGTYLEPAILAWWRDQHGMRSVSIPYGDDWHAQWVEQPEYLMGDWAAATPDATAFVEAGSDWEPVLVEAKSAADMSEWGDEGTDVIPGYYLVQVQWQMHVSGIHRCYVPVIGPRLKFAEYVVDYDAESGPLLERRMREFYDSLTADTPPDLDDTVATWNAVRKVHKDIEPGVEVELAWEEAHALVAHQAASKALEPLLREAKSTVVDRMGRAQYATHNGVRIARRQADGPDRTKFVVVAKPTDLTTALEGAVA